MSIGTCGYRCHFFDLDRSDWIDTWTKYENGKATIIAESIATDAFLKTNAAH